MSLPVAVGTVIAERYRVDGVLGQGGMGVVVMATHLVLQQRVAIKFLRRDAMDQDAVQRFVREAQAAAKVQSEHVARVQDVALLEDGTPYIVMEYLEGAVLSKMLAEHEALPIGEAVRYALQTCQALVETHAAGIIHGDLKPENIYIAGPPDGLRRVKLLDFGISKIAAEGKKADRGSDSVMGTPLYMAPEQFDKGIVTAHSDLWALGVVLYEMLSGDPPFQGATVNAIRDRVASSRIPPILRQDMPPGLLQLIERCLQKDPRKRFDNALDLACALEELAPIESSSKRHELLSTRLRTGDISQRLVPTVVLRERRGNRGRWALTVLGLFVIAGLALFLVSAKNRFKRAEASPTPSPVVAVDPPPTAPATAASLAEPMPAEPSTTIAMKGSAATPSSAGAAPTRSARPHAARQPAEGDRFGTRK